MTATLSPLARVSLVMPALPTPPAGFELACFTVHGDPFGREFKPDCPLEAMLRLLEIGLSKGTLILVATDAEGIESRSCELSNLRGVEAWTKWK